MIDLHIHSSCSDGDFLPEEVVEMCQAAGFSAVAVCDHDTLEGSRRACLHGKKIGIEVVPAVEISASLRGQVLHILGYYIDLQNADLAADLQKICDYRIQRAMTMVENVNRELALEGKSLMDLEVVLKLAKEKPVTRPDLANYLIELGHVKNTQEAFSRWLNKYNIPNRDVSATEAVAMIRKAGGISVLAHPISDYMSLKVITQDPVEQKNILQELKLAGLGGVEVYRYKHTQQEMSDLLAVVQELGLIATGGSDFHGPSNEIATPGLALFDVPDEALEQLKVKAGIIH